MFPALETERTTPFFLINLIFNSFSEPATLSHLALTFLSSFVRSRPQCDYSSTQQPNVMFLFSFWERGEIIKIKWKRVVKVEIETKNVRLHVRHIGFLCYLNSDEILLWGSWLEKQGTNIHAALRRFRNIWHVLTSQKCSRDSSRVITFSPFRRVHCLWLFPSYLDHYLIYSLD